MKDPEKMVRHAEMERRECRLCLFFDPETKRCSIGMRDCVLTELQEGKKAGALQKIPFFPCSRCPYGQGARPCVSFCMKKLLKEWRAERGHPERRGADDA